MVGPGESVLHSETADQNWYGRATLTAVSVVSRTSDCPVQTATDTTNAWFWEGQKVKESVKFQGLWDLISLVLFNLLLSSFILVSSGIQD